MHLYNISVFVQATNVPVCNMTIDAKMDGLNNLKISEHIFLVDSTVAVSEGEDGEVKTRSRERIAKACQNSVRGESDG